LSLEELVANDEARRFTDAMPSADVWVSLIAARHRNPQSRWESNDMFDIDAMCVAVPYCDVVVTDKATCHAVHAAGLPGRLGTIVIPRLDELGGALSALL
jgi:hypothetical protein